MDDFESLAHLEARTFALSRVGDAMRRDEALRMEGTGWEADLDKLRGDGTAPFGSPDLGGMNAVSGTNAAQKRVWHECRPVLRE